VFDMALFKSILH